MQKQLPLCIPALDVLLLWQEKLAIPARAEGSGELEIRERGNVLEPLRVLSWKEFHNEA